MSSTSPQSYAVDQQEVDHDPFAQPALQVVVPTTEAQREVWLADQLGTEASLAYNESAAFDLKGGLDVAALQAALGDLVQRHEALRATLSDDGLQMMVAERGALPLHVHDLDGLAGPQREAAVAAHRARVVETPFDLVNGPLVRADLLRLGEQHHLLLLTAHHVVCDGWSLGVMAPELGELYSARRAGRGASLPAADRYSDYALKVDADPAVTAADQQYWLSQFKDGAPVLDLPMDRPRPARRGFASRREDVMLDAALVAELKRLAGRQGSTLYGVLLGGFAALLARLSGQDDLVIGVPAAGQAALEMDALVGHCVNLLPLRIRVAPEHSATQLLREAQARLLDGFDHQRYTFGTLLKQLPLVRDQSRLSLVSVMFNVDQALDDESLGFEGLQVELGNNPRHFENFELFVNATPRRGALCLECQYNTGLFDGATVRRWMASYECLLRALLAEPGQRVDRLQVVPAEQFAQLSQWNATAMAYDRTQTVAGLLEGWREGGWGARVAVDAGGEALGYAQLHGRAEQLARLLRARGVGRGSLVGLCVERGPQMVVAQLAVLKSGAGYVPLDPAYPAERLAYMAQDAQLAVLVTQSALAGLVPWPREASVWLDEDAGQIDAQPAGALAADAQRDARAGDAAYVIYTSGSTGRPKGVVVPHAAVVNFLLGMQREPGLKAADVVLAVTTLSFDIAVLELLLPLSVGARIVLATREQVLEGGQLKGLLRRHGATLMQATPATWRMLVEAGWEGGAAGFKALVGGEALPADLAQQLLQRGCEVWNMYGPTETTVWSTCTRVMSAEGISIGRPIANTQVHVLDEQRQPVPIGVAGEIWIGGDGVTLGYLNRAELTAERFVEDPYNPGRRMYRTGDKGRWRHDGQIEHLGRLDFQVKVRGYRIELGEIEAALATHEAVGRCVVVTREDQPGDVRLVAYVVPRGGEAGGASLAGPLKAHLAQTLPAYMLPQHIVALPAIPLLPNGKIDRKSLPAPHDDERADGAADSANVPRTDAEIGIAVIWSELLGVARIGTDDNFFDLGGHSLLAMRAVMQIEKRLQISLPVRRLIFETLGQLAATPPGLPAPSGAAAREEGGTAPRKLGVMGRLLGAFRPGSSG